jgi:hypothetical protein
MKGNFRLQLTQLFTAAKQKAQVFQTTLIESSQAIFRVLKLRLSTITKLSPQSIALQFLALTATALMVILAIGGLQTIAQGTWSADTSAPSPPLPSPPPTWAGLPAGPTVTQTAPDAKNLPQPQKSANFGSVSQLAPAQTMQTDTVLAQVSLSRYAPKQQAAPADPTNYGERYAKDIYGNPVHNAPLIVLHETVGTADSALNTFQTPHQDENLQVSYHSVIRRDGTVVYIVPPDKRAFGAGDSAFNGPNGEESVKTHHLFPPSVNNFSYHISLESPPDGDNDAAVHSGYTDAQYRSLAWLVAHTSVPDQRIATHRAVDRSGSRIDPRSFEAETFFTYLRTMPRPYVNQQSS